MSAKTIVTRTALCAGAAALGAAGLVASPAAHADSCTVKFEVLQLTVRAPGRTYDLAVPAQGSTLSGDLSSTNRHESQAWGHVSNGIIAGNEIDFIIDWGDRFGGGATHFRGTVGADGFAHGTARGSAAHAADNPDDIEFEQGDWDSLQPLNCPAPVATGPAAGQKTATVVSDVDVYDKKNEPDGAGTFVGILRSGNTVQLLSPCQKKAWCNISGGAVPGGSGWVWGALEF
jgi:hypothetical protein